MSNLTVPNWSVRYRPCRGKPSLEIQRVQAMLLAQSSALTGHFEAWLDCAISAVIMPLYALRVTARTEGVPTLGETAVSGTALEWKSHLDTACPAQLQVQPRRIASWSKPTRGVVTLRTEDSTPLSTAGCGDRKPDRGIVRRHA